MSATKVILLSALAWSFATLGAGAFARADAARPSITPSKSSAPDPRREQMEQAVSPSEREAKARQYFTDTVLTTQKNEQVRFFTDVLKDKVVLISFVYTNCGDACPLIVHKLAQAKRELGSLFGSQVRFVSISIDPERDTPPALTNFARKFDALHPEWIFLTGTRADVERVVRKLGAWTESVDDHFTGLIMGNVAEVRWRKVRPDAPPHIIAEELRVLAGGSRQSDANVRVPFAGAARAR